MTGVGRSRWTGRKRWGVVLACAPSAIVGCGGDEPAPTGTEVATNGAPGAGHGDGSTPPGAEHGGPHGGPAGRGGPAGHGEAAYVPPDAEQAAPTAAHDEYVPPEAAVAGPGGTQLDPRMTPPPGGAHGGPGGRPPGSPYAAHGAPGGAQTQPGAAPAAGAPATTEDWLGGLAAGIFGSGTEQGAAPGPQAGIPAGPGGAHGEDGPGDYVPPDGEGYAPGEAGGAAQQFEPGTAEYAAQQFVLKIQSGETTGFDEIISEKTTDEVLAPLRDGKADAALMQRAKELSAGAQLRNIRDAAGGAKLFVVQNAAGQIVTITTRRDGENYKVAGLKIDTPRGRRP